MLIEDKDKEKEKDKDNNDKSALKVKASRLKIQSEEEYGKTLEKLKLEFEEKFNNTKQLTIFSIGDFEKISTLGDGAFGTVKLYKYIKTNQIVAIKIMEKESIIKKKQLQHAFYEKQILQSMDFPFVMKMLFAFKDNVAVYFGMLYINGGDLFNLLRKKRKFSENQTKFYATQVFLALEYLHYLDLVYRDLKPENIMIDSTGYLVLTDFGFCKKIDGRTTTLCGTPEYLAPEMIQTKPYSKAVDWWSYGILIYEFVAGVSPFYSNTTDPMAIYAKIVTGKYKMPTLVTTEMKNFIDNLLQVDPVKRYGNLANGTNDIRKHKWFEDINWLDILNKKIKAPYVPKIANEMDTTNFDKLPEKKIVQSPLCKYEKEFEDF